MKKMHYKTRQEWETLRNELIAEGRIGGSMVGTACGVDPWKSPYTLWAEMTGAKQVENLDNKEAIRVGRDLEDYVADRFCALTGKKVHRENAILTNDAYPHLFASIDRKIANEDSGLECKTASAYRDGAFADGNFPDGYFRQVKTYLAVTGLERWYLAVLIMGIDFRVFCITTNPDDYKTLPSWLSSVRYVSQMELDECEEDAATFISLVQSNTPPALAGTDEERSTINLLNGNQSSGEVVLEEDVDDLINTRAFLKAQGDCNKEELKKVENRIILALGKAETGITPDHKITYKYSTTKRLDAEKVKAALGGEIPEECYKVSYGPTLRINPIKKNFK